MFFSFLKHRGSRRISWWQYQPTKSGSKIFPTLQQETQIPSITMGLRLAKWCWSWVHYPPLTLPISLPHIRGIGGPSQVAFSSSFLNSCILICKAPALEEILLLQYGDDRTRSITLPTRQSPKARLWDAIQRHEDPTSNHIFRIHVSLKDLKTVSKRPLNRAREQRFCLRYRYTGRWIMSGS